MARILVVDPEHDVRSLIADLLANAGHEVHCAADGAEALTRLDESSAFDLLLSDLSMPAIEGIGLYWEIASRCRISSRGSCTSRAPSTPDPPTTGS